MKPEITHCVDGHEFENEESNLAGDGQFPPFRIFDIAAQDYLSVTFPDRESAERAMRAIPNAVFE